jgi:hypothetical protein
VPEKFSFAIFLTVRLINITALSAIKDEEDDEEAEEAPRQQRKPNSSAQLGLSGVVSMMLRTRKISTTEASILLDLIRAENEYVMAAFELYESDEKIEELQVRCD